MRVLLPALIAVAIFAAFAYPIFHAVTDAISEVLS